MIVQDNFIHKWGESVVRIVGSGVDTNTRVGPFGSGEDSLLEGESVFVNLILAFFPNIWGEAFAEDRLGSGWEERHTGDGFWAFEVGSHEGTLGIGWSGFSWGSGNGGSVLSTHSKYEKCV